MVNEGAGQNWSDREISVVVESYFRMLTSELAGVPFVKAREIELVRQSVNRSKGSVEYKFGNVSAVMRDLQIPYVDGYKPYGNRQEALAGAVVAYWADHPEVRAEVVRGMQKPAPLPVADLAWELELTPPPAIEFPDAPWSRRMVGQWVDFVQIEQDNRSLGASGEALVVQHERRMLKEAGLDKLARSVEHVSVTKGDGLGYDVRSFDPSGCEKLIEVKTTRRGPGWPFYVSHNELQLSKSTPVSFHLYRVYHFGRAPASLYILKGSLASTCQLKAVSYRAAPRQTGPAETFPPAPPTPTYLQ